MKTLIVISILISACLCSACVSQHPVPEIKNVYVATTQTTSPEPTFVHPKSATYVTKSTIKPDVGPTVVRDPVVGSWQMVNGPYDCMAYFLAGNNGVIRCNAMVASGTKSFAWSLNETNSYYIGLSDGTGITSDAFINPEGHMTSKILPEGAYLVKV